ncbi:phage tail protein [Lachnospiraceae bacterium 46-61]
MSERKYFAILTDIGQQKVSAFASGGEKVNITAFVVGDANGEYYTPTTDMTEIKNEVWRGVVSNADVVKDAQNVMRVSTVIPAEVNGFIVREMGLYDENGQLIAIGNTPPMPKVMLEEGVSTELNLSMRFAVKNTEALTFVTDPHTVIMTKDMLDTHNVDNNAHKELLDGKFDKTGGTITGNTTMQGNLMIKGSSNYGNKINFGDGDYVHISEPTDDNMEIKANNVNFVVSGNITQNGNKIGGAMTRDEINNVMRGAGYFNVALGANTLINNTTGRCNTANGDCALQENTTGGDNTANGFYALRLNTTGNYNTANGCYVLEKNTTGDYNTANGCFALRLNTTGSDNTANGYYALESNTTGRRNTANGCFALGNNTIGNYNTANGFFALANNTTGDHNIAVGSHSLECITSGSNNVGIGFGALINIKESENNTAIGFLSLSQAESGCTDNVAIGIKAMGNKFNFSNGSFIGSTYSNIINNTAIGVQALGNITSSANANTAIGHSALVNLSTYNNCTGLGYNAQVTGSNQVQLGNSNVTIYAQKALVTRSDERDKIDIEDSPLGLNFILQLRPRKYRMNSREAYFEQGKERDFTATNDGSKAGKRPHYGLIAQEVKEVMNELGVDFAGYLDSKVDGGEDVLSLGYTEFIAPMIKAIQEQQQMIKELQKQIEELKQ